MKAYFTFFRIRLIHTLQYRTAALAAVSTQFFWGFMEILLYRAFYVDHADRFPMEFSHLVSYIWLSQAFLALLNLWQYEHELFDMITSGSVAYEYCRPVSLYGMWFCRNAAVRTARAMLRCVPILLIASLLPEPFRLHFAPDAATFLGFLVSFALAFAVTNAYILVLYFLCFFTMSPKGILLLMEPISGLCSGGVIPLPFMPTALSKVLGWLPFAAMQNAPFRIYSGDIAGTAMVKTILLQLFWLIALVLAGLTLEHKGAKRLCIQGG